MKFLILAFLISCGDITKQALKAPKSKMKEKSKSLLLKACYNNYCSIDGCTVYYEECIATINQIKK